MSEIAVMLAEGFEEIEGLTVVDICRRCGIGVTTVSISDDRNVLGSHGIPVITDTVFSEVDFDKIDMIVSILQQRTKLLEQHRTIGKLI